MSGRYFRRLPFAAAVLAASAAYGQTTLSCQAIANPLLARGEGLTERMGEIVLQCTGGSPGARISGNLTVFLSVPMTNRVDATGFSDLSLSVDSGFGFQPANVRAAYLTAASQSFSGFTFTVSATGAVTIRLSNLRGAVNQLGVNSTRQVTASLSFTAGSLVSISNNIFSVATVVRSLYSSYTSQLIATPGGTPPIADNSMTDALSNHSLGSTIRISEGFNSALGPHTDPNFQQADFGSRVIVRYAGVPAGAHIWVPDGVVGYDGVQPTSVGDYGFPAGVGVYTPGSGALLLLRIVNADSRGAGLGSGPVIAKPSTTTQFDTMTEVAIGPDGTGQAVYEVFDANPSAVQSATIPSFLDAGYGLVQTPTQITQDVVLGATSTTFETTPTAVIPRFVPIPAPDDCLVVGDCGASYFPKLTVNSTRLDVSLTSLDGTKTQFLTVSNAGGGNFVWKASVVYTGGVTGGYSWLRLSPASGINGGTLRLDLVPGNLANGVYDAIITIDGGPLAGTAQVHVTMRFAYQAPVPVVINGVNAANLKPGILVPGSAASILGDRLLGRSVGVTFDGSPARILSANSVNRIDVQVPYDQAGKQYALVVVTIDGSSSTPGLLVPIGVSAPQIYPGAIQNADNTSNNASNGAVAGTQIQVYATGLPVSGVYTGMISDRVIDGDSLVYAGPAPTLVGVQLMTMVVPADLPSFTTGVAVCGGLTVDTQVCSDPLDLTVIAAPASSSARYVIR